MSIYVEHRPATQRPQHRTSPAPLQQAVRQPLLQPPRACGLPRPGKAAAREGWRRAAQMVVRTLRAASSRRRFSSSLRRLRSSPRWRIARTCGGVTGPGSTNTHPDTPGHTHRGLVCEQRNVRSRVAHMTPRTRPTASRGPTSRTTCTTCRGGSAASDGGWVARAVTVLTTALAHRRVDARPAHIRMAHKCVTTTTRST